MRAPSRPASPTRWRQWQLLDNPARRQGAAVNAAVAAFWPGHTHLIRVDAHSRYAHDFLDVLLEDAAETGAASVVVGMVSAGAGVFQRLNAATQNSRIGNGGSKHRRRGAGEFVDHGHHALMEIAAIPRAGRNTIPISPINEDAELDHRLRRARGTASG